MGDSHLSILALQLPFLQLRELSTPNFDSLVQPNSVFFGQFVVKEISILKEKTKAVKARVLLT